MMRDKLIEIIGDALIESMGDHSAVADAILAALPGMAPDLVFECSSSNEQLYKAVSNFGGYYIEHSKSGAFIWWAPFGVGKLKDYTIEAAKAAANAHHRAAIAKAAGWTTC